MLKSLFLLLLVLLAVALIFSVWRSQPLFDETVQGDPWASARLAPPDVALTLARSNDGDVLLVTGLTDAGIQAVNLSAVDTSLRDGVHAWRKLGGERLNNLASQPNVAMAVSALDVPIDVSQPHIAAGTNYLAHAEEVGLDADPFIFPKLSDPTPWNAFVEDGARLDYEVEVCVVTLGTHSKNKAAPLGYLLCQDFTDRWSLVRDIDTDTPMGTTGFPSAKGGATRLPMGPFLVIPLEDDFHEQIQVTTWVNERLHQRASAKLMIWPPRTILDRAVEGCQRQYQTTARPISLEVCGLIKPSTLVLTGTPQGVVFSLTNLWNPAIYLNPGDEVLSTGTYLGVLRNQIRQ